MACMHFQAKMLCVKTHQTAGKLWQVILSSIVKQDMFSGSLALLDGQSILKQPVVNNAFYRACEFWTSICEIKVKRLA